MIDDDILSPTVLTRLKQSERLAALLQLLDEKAYWSVADLAAKFDVSEETVRRDVRQLERDGRVQKTHGGVCIPSNLSEAPYRIRMREQADAKLRIAQYAAGFVSEGMTLLLDSGTTCLWLARALLNVRGLTIVTNSIDIAYELIGRPYQRVLLAGGPIKSDYHAAFGPEAIGFCSRFSPDLTVMSMGAIDAERGFLDFDAEEAMFKQTLLAQARRVMVLADATKFENAGFIQVAGFADVHDLVTSAPPPPDIQAVAKISDLKLHVASA